MIQQIKIFKSVDTELAELEREINRWMRKVSASGGNIVAVTGNLANQPTAGGGPMNSFAGGDVIVIVTYEVEPPQLKA